MKENDKDDSFFDTTLVKLVEVLKEELDIEMLERHDKGHESEDEATVRIDEMCRIVGETCKVEKLKDVKENVKKEKHIEGEDKRIVAKRDEERDLVDASEADSDMDSSEDESEEEC